MRLVLDAESAAELMTPNPISIRAEATVQDVLVLLEAGIDVFTTVNVQHLESLNDQVAEISGVRVRER